MKILRLIFFYLDSFAKRKFKLLLAILLTLFVLVFSAIFFGDSLFRPKVTQGIIGTYLEEDLPELITNLLSDSLIEVDNTGTPQPNLVKEIKHDKEGKLYTITLKDNLFWTDGKEVVSQDISIPIHGINASYPNSKTIEVKLSDSFSPFPTLLTKPIFKKDNRHTGIGPYTLDNIQKDQIFVKKVVLKSSDRSLPDLVIKVYPNEKIAKNALNLGEISALIGVNEVSDFSDQKTLSSQSFVNYQQIVTIFYNTQDPILSDENFRVALSYASPKIPDEVEATTSIPPNSWAFNDDVRDYLADFESAQTYLKRVQKGKDETITLTATSSLKGVGERVVESWKKLGIKAVLRVESGIPQNFQALLIAQNIPSDPDQYSLWHSTQKQTNISKLSDPSVSPRIDKDLEDGRKITDIEVRRAKYADFQKVLLDHAPATFLYFPKYNVVYRKKAEDNLKKVLDLQLSNLNR
jgi:peptide/nickel transport system substrate-binding protein